MCSSDLSDVGLLVGVCAGVVVGIVAYNLSGNRKVAAAGADEKRAALAFQADPGRAALYIVRTGFIGVAAGMNFTVDDAEAAQLKGNRFTRISLAPGPHLLTASFGGGLTGQTKPAELAFTAGAGEIVVVHVTMGLGGTKNPIKIEQASLEAMRAQITGLTMSKPDLATLA